MPAGKQIKVIIAADGTCAIDALNFVGSTCQLATQELARLLGGAVTHQELKPEAWLREPAGQRQAEQTR